MSEGVRFINPDLIRQLQNVDPSLDILWNQRIGRHVVVQKLPEMNQPVTASLRGVLTITGDQTCYKPMFTCEFDQPGRHRKTPIGEGIKVIPSFGWIRKRLMKFCPSNQRDNATINQFHEEEARRDREIEKTIEDGVENMGKELLTYGGIGDHGHDQRLGKTHHRIRENPLAQG